MSDTELLEKRSPANRCPASAGLLVPHCLLPPELHMCPAKMHLVPFTPVVLGSPQRECQLITSAAPSLP